MHLHNYERGQSIRFLGKRRRSHQQKTEYRVPKTENSFLLCATDKRHIAHVHVHVRVHVLSPGCDLGERWGRGTGTLEHNAAELQSQSQSVTPIRKAASETKGVCAWVRARDGIVRSQI